MKSLLFFIFLMITLGCSVAKKLYPHLENAPKGLIQKWVVKTHETYVPGQHPVEYSSPILVQGAIIQGSRAGGVGKYRQSDGKRIWYRSFEYGTDGDPEVDIKNNRVFIGANDGNFYCLNFMDGEIIWSQDLRTRIIAQPLHWKGRVYILSSNQTFYAFDAKTGKKLWSHHKNIIATSLLQATTIKGGSRPLVWRNRIIVGFGDGGIMAFNQASGLVLWKGNLPGSGKFNDVDASPVMLDGSLIWPSFDGALYRITPKDGKIRRIFNAGGARDVVIHENEIFLPSNDGHLYVLNSKTFRLKWKFKVEYGVPTSVLPLPGGIVVPTSNRFIYLLDSRDGYPLDRKDLGGGSGVYAKARSDANHAYIFSAFGNLYRFDLMDPILRRELSKNRFHSTIH